VLVRRPFALPYSDRVGALAAILRGETVAARADDRFVEAALHHRLAGFALVAAREGRLRLPDPQRDVLTERLIVATLRSALMRRELGPVAGALRDAGVEPLLVKGPAVADRWYEDRSLRTFVDLDLLVSRDRLGAAAAALRPLGYEPQVEFRPGFGELHGHDVHVVRGIGRSRIDVELHWRIGDDPAGEALGFERLAQGAERLDGVAAPAPPEQLLALALHLLGDRAKRLIWVEDVVRVARVATGEEWSRAFEVAEATGLSWVLHRALDYAAALLGLERERPLPAGPPPPWGPLRAAETLDLRASTHVGRLAALGWGGRARYLRDVLVPTRAGLDGTVGGDGAPLWRLAGRHAATVIRGLGPRR